MATVDTVAARAPGAHRRFRAVLFFAFAFAVMADPVSSVAYAIESALRALGGHLDLLLPTMGLVIGLIALVTLNYWQLVRSFPEGGGSPEAAGRAFGQQWTFLPIGALVVDFALTIAISIAAAGSAVIAYLPAIAPARVPLALGLVALVAVVTWFGHGGRMVFAVMTSLFMVAAVVVLPEPPLPARPIRISGSSPGARHRERRSTACRWRCWMLQLEVALAETIEHVAILLQGQRPGFEQISPVRSRSSAISPPTCESRGDGMALRCPRCSAPAWSANGRRCRPTPRASAR